MSIRTTAAGGSSTRRVDGRAAPQILRGQTRNRRREALERIARAASVEAAGIIHPPAAVDLAASTTVEAAVSAEEISVAAASAVDGLVAAASEAAALEEEDSEAVADVNRAVE